MANSTRSSCKSIEENSKGRRSGGGESNSSLSIDASRLRRSTRDTSCKKRITSEKSVSQQLGQADKQVATPPVTRSLAKKVTISSHLRRSKRCNKQSPSLISSGSILEISSKSLKLNSKKRKVERREKALKQSTFGTMDATESVNEKCESPQVKRMRMTARAYKALFQKQEKKVKVSGKYEELAGQNKSPAKSGSNSGGCLSKEGAAAVESGTVSAANSFPGKETAENPYEEESTQINQINSAGQLIIRDTDNVDVSVNHKIHNLPLLSVPELVGSDRSDDGSKAVDTSIVAELPEVADSTAKEKGNDVDVYEERVIEGKADATAMTNCKDKTSVASPPIHQENHDGESTAMNMRMKSGEPEDGVDISLDENNVQMSVQKLEIQGNEAVADVEQLPGCSTFGCKADASQFTEYWVPAQLSHVQLEKYCSVFLSSSLTLCSSLKSDILGALGDVLADTRKCCDHPYLLDKDKDNSLDSFLTSLELNQMLDIGIKASGKLDLVVKFLVEMRSRGMRTLILFQSISNFGKDPKSSGDILDDVMRQRFGVDSYERVDAGLLRSKVQSALNNFNNKELGRFVFLLEARACRPSIKLSSIDVVIVFTSDMNPANDIRNLQKLTLDSKSENIKVLRVYSCFTVEEAVLINAKQRIGMDGRLEEINLLLRGGASYLFDRLKEFHCSNDESSKLIISDPLHANDVVKEFLSMLSVGENNIRNRSMIVRVQQNAGAYSTESPLVGESKSHLSMEKLPHIFWAELLEGKHPSWRYLSNSGQRNRKRLQNNSDYHVNQGDNNDETGKKRIKLATDNGVRTKLGNDNGLQSSTKRVREEGMTASSNKEAARSNPPPPENGASNSMAECDEATKRLNAQRNLLGILQPEVSRLCEVVNLTDDVKQKADLFLDYVISNHRVDREPESILQAFQLALCWTAASMSRVKINHKESFELAKDRLSYCCEWDQADYVYKMMRFLKEMFLNKRQGSEAEDNQTPSSNISQSSVSPTVNTQVDVVDITLVQDHSIKSDVSDLSKVVERSMSRSIKKIKNKSCKRMAKLLLLQEKERNQICSTFEEAKAILDKQHLIEAAVIRSLHGEGPTRTDRLNALESEYNRRAKDHKIQMLASISELERAHIAAKTALQLKEASQIKKLREWVRTELLKKTAESTGGVETCFSDSDGPDIIELNGVKASAAPQEAPYEGTSSDAAGAPEDAPNEARAPEEALDAAGAPEEALDAAGAPDDAPNGAPEDAPNGARSPEEAPDAPLTVISASEDSSNPVMRFSLSSKSTNVSLLVPVVHGIFEHHVGASRLDRDQEDVSVGPCSSESTPDRAISSLSGDETSLNEHHTASALSVETSHLPSGKGPPTKETTSQVPDHAVPTDAQSENMQIDGHLEGTVPAHEETCNVLDREAATDIGSIYVQAPQDLMRGISGDHIVGDVKSRLSNISLCSNRPNSEAFQKNVGVLDATSADEQDISGNPNQQESRPERRDNSTLPQLVDTPPQDDPVLTSLPEVQNQSDLRSTPNRTHDGNPSFIERLNAPALESEPLVSSTTKNGQAQPASNTAQTDQILDINIPDLARASGTGRTYLNVQELRQVPEPLESSRPLAHGVQCTINTQVSRAPSNSIASGSGIGSIQPSFYMPSGKSDPLQVELDKIRRQMDHSIKNFEETKKQLEVDCQKEIAEAVAKIRQKFVVKVQESEAEYVSKKKELETNLNKVVMNKVLAAAFRYKCMDVKKSATPGTIRPDGRNSIQPWITSAASVWRPSSSLSSIHAAAVTTSNSQSITPPTTVVPPRASVPARPPPLVKTLHHSSFRPSSTIPQREVVQRSPAPHLQSASRPSPGVPPHFIPPPPRYQPQTSSVPLAQFPRPTAATQTGPSSTLANRMGSRIPPTPNSLDRTHFIANLPNPFQSSNFRFPLVNNPITTSTTTATNASSFSEVSQFRYRSNESAIIDAASIIELSDEE